MSLLDYVKDGGLDKVAEPEKGVARSVSKLRAVFDEIDAEAIALRQSGNVSQADDADETATDESTADTETTDGVADGELSEEEKAREQYKELSKEELIDVIIDKEGEILDLQTQLDGTDVPPDDAYAPEAIGDGAESTEVINGVAQAGEIKEPKSYVINRILNGKNGFVVDSEKGTIVDADGNAVNVEVAPSAKELTALPYGVFVRRDGDTLYVESLADSNTILKELKKAGYGKRQDGGVTTTAEMGHAKDAINKTPFTAEKLVASGDIKGLLDKVHNSTASEMGGMFDTAIEVTMLGKTVSVPFDGVTALTILKALDKADEFASKSQAAEPTNIVDNVKALAKAEGWVTPYDVADGELAIERTDFVSSEDDNSFVLDFMSKLEGLGVEVIDNFEEVVRTGREVEFVNTVIVKLPKGGYADNGTTYEVSDEDGEAIGDTFFSEKDAVDFAKANGGAIVDKIDWNKTSEDGAWRITVWTRANQSAKPKSKSTSKCQSFSQFRANRKGGKK